MTATAKTISNLDTNERDVIRHAVDLAVTYWPNAHLGTRTVQQDIRSAFRTIRSWEPVIGLLPAAYRVENDAYRHQDM